MIGTTVEIDGIERTITRLTARVTLTDVAVTELVDDELDHGENVARRNIQEYVYARPQGANTRYVRTMTLLNSVKSGRIRRGGATAAGQVYISREKFKRVYYPPFVEWGDEVGAPYEGRHYWEKTVAELKAD